MCKPQIMTCATWMQITDQGPLCFAGSLPNVRTIDLSENLLTGNLNMSEFVSLADWICAACLTGYANCSALAAAQSLQTGVQKALCMPAGLAVNSKVLKLNVSHNSLNGTLPADWSQATTLTDLDVHSNQLTGDPDPCQ